MEWVKSTIKLQLLKAIFNSSRYQFLSLLSHFIIELYGLMAWFVHLIFNVPMFPLFLSNCERFFWAKKFRIFQISPFKNTLGV